MKVGIITVHSVPNYGAMLQSYALSTFLRTQGVDAEVIDYRQPGLAEYFRFRWSFPPKFKHWLRVRRCADFVERSIPLSRRRYHHVDEFLKDVGQYDAFITGSDQVWFTGPVQYFDPMYFLDFPVKTQRKISYAASVGGLESFGEAEGKARAALNGINSLSVRDEHTASLVEPLVQKAATRVLDPVFLSDFGSLTDQRNPMREPYLAVFGDFRNEREEIVRSVADAAGLKRIVTLQYSSAIATERVASPGPREWLTYLKHADFILTSYFHGTALAVRFKKQFLAYPTKGRRIKVQTMLDRFGLSERCLSGDAGGSLLKSLVGDRIEWASVDGRIDPQIEASKLFLQEALH